MTTPAPSPVIAAARPFRRGLLVVLVAAAVSGFTFLEAAFAPKAELWPRWQAHNPASRVAIDHRPWQRFLDAFLRPGTDAVTRLAYGRATDADKQALHAYLDRLRKAPVLSLNRAEQRAYWINLYNALTVRLVLDHYPVASIQDIDISPGPFSSGPWDRKLLDVDGEPVSLNDIEHRILRPIWKDARIHYAVNCASIGCPNLQPTAFTAANGETLLDAAARAYVNHPRGARVEDGRLVASKIYAWFSEDFGGDEAGVIRHLRRYAAPPLDGALRGIESVAAYEYDWGLNDGGS